ncbi:cyclin-dependent kinase 9-B-like [Rhopalosiphum maidis]|uniref:cyclin-dependent kinase 9-B-like n=1 Tax=Rhopalosiphum maidis TaxID=43146 RepID=UPI000EFDE528|nr:cyclin-dependent kinase 9-B-like [Rhopalosiphum maidis]
MHKNISLPKHYTQKVKMFLMHHINNKSGCDLLNKLLILDLGKRYDADTALNHDFCFWKDPMPSNLTNAISQIKNHCHENSMLQQQIF